MGERDGGCAGVPGRGEREGGTEVGRVCWGGVRSRELHPRGWGEVREMEG